jgi:Bacterial SH3 domain
MAEIEEAIMNRIILPRSVCILLLLSMNCLFAQQAIVRKTASLRTEPGTTLPPEATLQTGDKLTLLDPTPEHGYYQVRTQDGKEGWVFSKLIKIVASPSSSEPAIDPESMAQGTCDPTLWSHVYKPTRLVVKQQCVTVTGIIVDATKDQATHEPDGVRHEDDADTHGWLKVDPQFEDLLNPGNMSNEGGNLVFEIVCMYHPPKQLDAQSACAGYASPIKIPSVGSHVKIVGSYVRDTNHAQWMEIHPVSSITVIP